MQDNHNVLRTGHGGEQHGEFSILFIKLQLGRIYLYAIHCHHSWHRFLTKEHHAPCTLGRNTLVTALAGCYFELGLSLCAGLGKLGVRHFAVVLILLVGSVVFVKTALSICTGHHKQNNF